MDIYWRINGEFNQQLKLKCGLMGGGLDSNHRPRAYEFQSRDLNRFSTRRIIPNRAYYNENNANG